ncbi:MAG: hypothetical protein PGN34_15740 [Methylobacterium frigidaeris]
MPQIWLTYEEMGEHFGCTSEAARAGAISEGLNRRRCSDGLTRVKLRPEMQFAYMREQVVRHRAGSIQDLQSRAAAFERGPVPAAALPAPVFAAPQSRVA